MHRWPRSLFLSLLLWAGCVNPPDFAVLESLAVGMRPEEAAEAIAGYGFPLGAVAERPETGWPSEREDFVALGWRAGQMERGAGAPISRAEQYPVAHGLLGAGILYLFYDEEGRLLSWFRYQIN